MSDYEEWVFTFLFMFLVVCLVKVFGILPPNKLHLNTSHMMG